MAPEATLPGDDADLSGQADDMPELLDMPPTAAQPELPE